MVCGNILKAGAAQLDIELDSFLLSQLCRYFDELRKWNRKINIVAQAADQEIFETHFLDSLTMLPLLALDPAKTTVLDIGSGGGFPGLVIKVARPDLAVTLIEPRQKRVSFLKHIIRTLRLKKTEVLMSRLQKETTAPTINQQFSVITCRAFTSITSFLELVEPLSAVNGRVICMKGPKAEDEISQWQETQPHSPFQLHSVHHLLLPFSSAVRNLVVFNRRKT